MIRMRKLTDYGIVLLVQFVREGGERVLTAREVSELTHVPVPTVSKLLKLLSKGGFLASRRGINGGYSLDCNPDIVTLVEVIEALEGKIAITECSEEDSETCEDQAYCPLSTHWPHINLAVKSALAVITIRDISRPLPAHMSRAGWAPGTIQNPYLDPIAGD